MIRITQKEYDAKHKDYKSIWTTERTDIPEWDKIRHKYIGKRTMMQWVPGEGTSLLIEGMHFEIIQGN